MNVKIFGFERTGDHIKGGWVFFDEKGWLVFGNVFYESFLQNDDPDIQNRRRAIPEVIAVAPHDCSVGRLLRKIQKFQGEENVNTPSGEAE